MKKKIFIIILCVIVLLSIISCKKKTEETLVNMSLTNSFVEKEIIPSPIKTIELDEKIEAEDVYQEFEFYRDDFHITGRAQGLDIKMYYDEGLEGFFKAFLSTLNLGFDLSFEQLKGEVILSLPFDWNDDDLLYEILGKIFSYYYSQEPVTEVVPEIQYQGFSYKFLGFPLTLELIKDYIIIDCPDEFESRDVNNFAKVTREILSFGLKDLFYSVQNNRIFFNLDRGFEKEDLLPIKNSLEIYSYYEYKTISFLEKDIFMAIGNGNAYLLNPFQKEEAQTFMKDISEGFIREWNFVTNDIIEFKYDSSYSNVEFVYYLENELNNYILEPKVESSLEFEIYLGTIHLNFNLLNNTLIVVFSEKMNETLLIQKVKEIANSMGIEIGDIFYDYGRDVLILPILSSDYSETFFENLISSLHQYSK